MVVHVLPQRLMTTVLKNTSTVRSGFIKAPFPKKKKKEWGMVSCGKRKVKMSVVCINTNWYFWFIKQLDLPHLHMHLITEFASRKWLLKEIVLFSHPHVIQNHVTLQYNETGCVWNNMTVRKFLFLSKLSLVDAHAKTPFYFFVLLLFSSELIINAQLKCI